MSEAITPGVRRLVAYLNRQGFRTTDSGDGVTNVAAGMEGAMPFPNVAIEPGAPEALHTDAHALLLLLADIGIRVHPINDGSVPCIQATYDPADESGVILLTGVDDSMLPEGLE